MLIDNSQNSSSIQNVSYLIPIGIFMYIITSCFNSVLALVSQEIGMRVVEFDPYLNYWMTQIGTLVLTSLVTYFLIRRIWRRIITGEFNCARLFVSLFIAAVIAVLITQFGSKWFVEYLILIDDGQSSSNITSDYIKYRNALYPLIGIIDMVITVLVFTFAVRGSTNKTDTSLLSID